MRQLICTQDNLVEVTHVASPIARDGDLVVKMSLCGICGTDIMKVYDPTVPKPVQLGHEIVGTVERGIGRFAVGQRVAVAHHAPDYSSHYTMRGSETQDPVFKSSNVDPGGFAEFVRVPSDLVPHTVHAIPDAMPDERAVFMEPLACCLRALERVPVHAGDTALVVGVGAIGLLFVPLLREAGAVVIAADVREERLALARDWGAVAADDPLKAVAANSQSRGADVVILTVVNAATINMALAAVRDGGRIIPFGVKPGTALAIDLWQLYRREISLVTSYSATPSGLKQAMEMLAGAAFGFETLISHMVPLAEAQRGFDLLHEAKASKVVITG
jgi:L-iditol 2-dehydrogenase